jgi:hypothetical protein
MSSETKKTPGSLTGHLTSDNCKLINLCCFKAANLGNVTAAENYTLNGITLPGILCSQFDECILSVINMIRHVVKKTVTE